VFVDHCNSGHFCNELSTMPNANKVFVTTTCTINGYGYDDAPHKNGRWTYWFLEAGLLGPSSYGDGPSGHKDIEGNFQWAHDNYGKTGNDEPQKYDGDSSTLFYL